MLNVTYIKLILNGIISSPFGSEKLFSTNNLPSITPFITYENADSQKLKIFKDNKDKSGIYRWVNKINGKTSKYIYLITFLYVDWFK
jgi:uncharacterized protein YbcV (DUF1398 family)